MHVLNMSIEESCKIIHQNNKNAYFWAGKEDWLIIFSVF